MRNAVLLLAALGLLLTPAAWGQKGLAGQPAKDPDLMRALDATSAAFATAQRDAANGKKLQLSDSLSVANQRWAECYGKYREWPTSDTAWRSNFDAINGALLNAVNALTPGDNLPAAKAQVDAAVGTLSGLRSRNGILDLPASMDKLNASLEGLNTTIAGLAGKQLTPADVTALKTSFGAVRDSLALFNQAAVDANAFGLGDGELASLRKLILVQNIGIDSIYNILASPSTPQLMTQWQALRDQILAMLKDLQGKAAANPAIATGTATPQTGQSAADPSSTQKDNGDPTVGAEQPDRPRLFPRLRR